MVLGRAATLVAICLVAVSCAEGGTPEAAPTVTTSSPSTMSSSTTEPAVSTSTTSPKAVDPCQGLQARQSASLSVTPPLTEISGAVLSRRSPDAVWVHQDSGREPLIIELGLDGRELSRWTVTGADNVDWEDIAVADDPSGVRHLFVGDVGDNQRRRSHVEILRFAEPGTSEDSGNTAQAAVLRMELPEGPADVEALLVDPTTADIVLITKAVTGAAEVLVAPGAAWEPHGSSISMDSAGTLRLVLGQAVLAADLDPDGDLVAVRTPFSVLMWPHHSGEPIAGTLLDSDPCEAPAIFNPFGEALAVLDDGYALVGEGEAAELIIVR